jgi:hypothetical protein
VLGRPFQSLLAREVRYAPVTANLRITKCGCHPRHGKSLSAVQRLAIRWEQRRRPTGPTGWADTIGGRSPTMGTRRMRQSSCISPLKPSNIIPEGLRLGTAAGYLYAQKYLPTTLCEDIFREHRKPENAKNHSATTAICTYKCR